MNGLMTTKIESHDFFICFRFCKYRAPLSWGPSVRLAAPTVIVYGAMFDFADVWNTVMEHQFTFASSVHWRLLVDRYIERIILIIKTIIIIIKNNIIIKIRTFPECFCTRKISMQNNLVNLWSKRMLYHVLFTTSRKLNVRVMTPLFT